jgi:hypothetical protein
MNVAEHTTAFIAVAVGLVILLAVIVLSKPLRNLIDRFRVSRAITRLGTASMSNVVLSDGMEGHVFIEHLVLTPSKVLVVSVRRYSGAIFAAENMDMWAQVTDGGSYKFPNPLHEIQSAMGALKAQVPDAAVSGIILFGRDSTFPKGKPDGVMHISEIAKFPAPAQDTPVSPPVKKAWDRLLELKTTP